MKETEYFASPGGGGKAENLRRRLARIEAELEWASSVLASLDRNLKLDILESTAVARTVSRSRACELLGISRAHLASGRGESEADLRLHVATVFAQLLQEEKHAGYRSIWRVLQEKGVKIGRHRVREIMDELGLKGRLNSSRENGSARTREKRANPSRGHPRLLSEEMERKVFTQLLGGKPGIWSFNDFHRIMEEVSGMEIKESTAWLYLRRFGIDLGGKALASYRDRTDNISAALEGFLKKDTVANIKHHWHILAMRDILLQPPLSKTFGERIVLFNLLMSAKKNGIARGYRAFAVYRGNTGADAFINLVGKISAFHKKNGKTGIYYRDGEMVGERPEDLTSRGMRLFVFES